MKQNFLQHRKLLVGYKEQSEAKKVEMKQKSQIIIMN